MNTTTTEVKALRMYSGVLGYVIMVYRLYVNGKIYATYLTQAEAEFAIQYVR